MPRIRTIHPHFARAPTMGRIGRDARLFFILLWTMADDAGRLRLDPESLQEQLFPFDTDALMLLPAWLDELERQRCIERYGVEGVDYLRIVHWRRLQTIDRPTPSRLPASPSEPPSEAREARDTREESPRRSRKRGSGAIPREALVRNEPIVVDQQTVLRDFERIQANAEDDHSHAAALRAADLKARFGGVRPVASKRGTGAATSTPSPAELLDPANAADAAG